MLTPEVPPEPWHGFLADLDSKLEHVVSLHCIGGFAVSVFYGLSRPTGDVDFVEAIPASDKWGIRAKVNTIPGSS